LVAYRLDEIADHREQQHHEQHDELRIAAGNRGNPIGDDKRATQIGQHPAEGVGRPNRYQRQREDQACQAEVVWNLPDVSPVERRDHDHRRAVLDEIGMIGRASDWGDAGSKYRRTRSNSLYRTMPLSASARSR